jgi:hypothetical protein
MIELCCSRCSLIIVSQLALFVCNSEINLLLCLISFAFPMNDSCVFTTVFVFSTRFRSQKSGAALSVPDASVALSMLPNRRQVAFVVAMCTFQYSLVQNELQQRSSICAILIGYGKVAYHAILTINHKCIQSQCNDFN